MSKNANLDALVIRNINDIEAAMNHAIEQISPRVWQEVGRTVLDVCKDQPLQGFVEAEDEEVWLADSMWLRPGKHGHDADFWLGLDERTSASGKNENSWLANFVASGPEGSTMAFWLDQRIVGKSAWKKILKTNDDVLSSLRDCGFAFDEDDDRKLCLPLELDREKLAVAFETDDFDLVMEPVTVAVGSLVEALPHLQRLRKLALEAA